MKKITVQGTSIAVISVQNDDYISLTDMLKAKDGDFFISDWLRNRNTVEYLGIWESIYNPEFNYGEFAIIKSQGTYAHKDIAFEFGMWISAEFKIYLIREFQRLKEEEQQRLSLEWNLQRTLAKLNYRIHTDAVKEHILPPTITKEQASFAYASEADLLNVALFGKTAQQWRKENPKEKGNMRDYASLEQLIVLSNIESINALLLSQKISQGERLIQLNNVAITQMKSLLGNQHIRTIAALDAK